jgi:hypothetical protein
LVLLATSRSHRRRPRPGGRAFLDNQVSRDGAGRPGFARANRADGLNAIADFSVAPGDTEIMLSEVPATLGYPDSVARFRLWIWVLIRLRPPERRRTHRYRHQAH